MGGTMQTHGMTRAACVARCRCCDARRSGFCSALGDCSLAEFSERSALARYRKGSEIIAQGESCDRIGVIAEGLVKIATVTEGGEEYLLQVLRSGQLLTVPKDARSLFSWESVTDVEVCWIARGAWESFLQEQPLHFQSYLVTTAYQLEEMQLSVMNMRGRNTLQRVAFWLNEEHRRVVDRSESEIHIRLSRRDLASLLDMTVETLCRALRQLHDKKAIQLRTPDCVTVTDAAKLRLLARCPDEALRAAKAPPAVAAHRTHWDTAPVQLRAPLSGAPAEIELREPGHRLPPLRK